MRLQIDKWQQFAKKQTHLPELISQIHYRADL